MTLAAGLSTGGSAAAKASSHVNAHEYSSHLATWRILGDGMGFARKRTFT
jgi:hypothetical protein